MTLPFALPTTEAPSDLAAAVKGAASAPDALEGWDRAEKLAADHQRPEELAYAYVEAIRSDLPNELILELCQRAVAFISEWFEDGAAAVVLERALEVDPSADWAFRRLTMQLTVACRWDELLAVYDRVVAVTPPGPRRAELYGEAAQIARDLAGRSDRAIAYLEELAKLSPSDRDVADSLERLLEREGRWRELVDLWRGHLADLSPAQASARRAQIAGCLLDKLASPGEALAEALSLAEDSAGSPEAVAASIAVLERVFASADAPAEVRSRALAELRRHYSDSARPSDILRVLRLALEVGNVADKPALHREIADLLVAEGRDEEALGHVADLLVLEPGSDTALLRLRELGSRTGRLDRYAEALARAADATSGARARELLTEAARVRADEIQDPDGARALYRRLFEDGAAGDGPMLEICRRLDGLLDADDPLRIDVIERRAGLEPESDEKRRLRAEAARLASARSDADRALRAWELVLVEAPKDEEAHEAIIQILDGPSHAGQPEALVAALLRSAEAAPSLEAERANRVRAARVQETRLHASDAAVDAWTDIEARFGANEETIDALRELLSRAERWVEHAAVLERGLALRPGPAPARRRRLHQELGDSYRARTNEPARALDSYLAVLAEDPSHAGAIAGTVALLDEATCRPQATELLLTAFEQTEDWRGRLSLLEHRLAIADTDAARTALLLEAADLHEERAEDPGRALREVARALPYAPFDRAIEARLRRLADAMGDWTIAADALRQGVEALLEGASVADPESARARAADLRFARGEILEGRSDAEALESYRAALALAPGRADVAAATVRAATRAADWQVAVDALLTASRAHEGLADAAEVRQRLLGFFVDAESRSESQWAAMATTVEQAVLADVDLAPATTAELLRAVAGWHRDRRWDPDAAESVLMRALERDPSSVATLRLLAGVQRSRAGRPLVLTLLRLADAGDERLPTLKEAAGVAIDTLADAELTGAILERLLTALGDELRTLEGEASDEHAALATFAVDGLVQLARDDGEPARAVRVLERAADLGLGRDAARARLLQAAKLAESALEDLDSAVGLYRRVIVDHPTDPTSIERLTAIFEGRASIPDLLTLRRGRLAHADTLEERLDHRLAISSLLGRAGDATARLETLRENLGEAPGHHQTLEELCAVLDAVGQHAELAQVLEEQAASLDERGDHARAADLWTRASILAETTLNATARAYEARRRAAAGAPTAETFEALARLATARGDHTAAIDWLGERLAALSSDTSDRANELRVKTLAGRAEALAAAGRHAEARATLEAGLAAHPLADAIRRPLRGLYREVGAWDELAALLAGHLWTNPEELFADEASAPPPTVEELREAADVALKKLNAPARAVPILKAVVATAPTDRAARLELAATLRTAGGEAGLAEAKGILSGLLEEYGRRRPPERAEVHYQLAQVAAAAGDTNEARSQLETATAMSTEHAGALRMLAELYRAAGDLVRAERMYGALLLIALRQKPGAAEDTERPARSEVMINLYWILTELKQTARAEDMLASAFEAAKRSEHEANRLEAALKSAADHALHLRALSSRLARPDLASEERVAVLSDMADLLAGPLGRPDDAFATLLDAVEGDPASDSLRQRAAELATRANAEGRWADKLSELATNAEGTNEGLGAKLHLALGDVHERAGKPESPARALDHYQRAERLGADPLPIWRAIARSGAAVGDTGEQIRVLRQIAQATDAAGAVVAASDEVYRLAELELASQSDPSAGLATLEWALGREPDYARACRMLRDAADGKDASVLLAYERVARASGDPAALLDALDRATANGSGGMDLVREAAELAKSDLPREEALLHRAVALADAGGAGMGEAVWALTRLAERTEADDPTAALGWLSRAVEAAEHDEAQRLTTRAVEVAIGRLDDSRLAAEAWERLLARDRNDRDVWQPLLAIYRTLGDAALLEAKLSEAIDCAFDAAWRGELRVEHARLIEGSRPEDAASELDEVLRENEDAEVAAVLLTGIYERLGRHEELASLLERRIAVARGKDDGAAVAALSLRLGALVQSARPTEAVEVYRAALEMAPDAAALPLLEGLVGLFAGDDRVEERADAIERIVALTKGRAAADRALALASLREGLGDVEGAMRALDLGFRADPTAHDIRDQLAHRYRVGKRWSELSGMLEVEGAALPSAEGSARLREAAAIYLDRLDRPADAARALGLASERAPDDVELLRALSHALAKAADHEGVRARISTALSTASLSHADRVGLLRLRAELLAHDRDAVIADLEAAHRFDPRGVAGDLADALAGALETATHGDTPHPRLLRFVDIALGLQQTERALDALNAAIVAYPNDPSLVRVAAEIAGYAGLWDRAVQLCARLVEISSGPDRKAAALLFAGACELAGYANDARPVLEQVLAESPYDPELRGRLHRIYEAIGAYREEAAMFLDEAARATDPTERLQALRRGAVLLLERAGDAAAAVAPLEAAREIKPRDHEIGLLLADAYIHSGKLQEAADFLDAAIQAQKGRRTREASAMQHRMAMIARAVGDQSNELAWLNAAFESDAQNGEAAAALATLATEVGQLDVAVKALKAITLMKAPKPISRAMAYLRQALIAQHQGDVRKANMLAKKAQSEDPSLVEAQTFLSELG